MSHGCSLPALSLSPSFCRFAEVASEEGRKGGDVARVQPRLGTAQEDEKEGGEENERIGRCEISPTRRAASSRERDKSETRREKPHQREVKETEKRERERAEVSLLIIHPPASGFIANERSSGPPHRPESEIHCRLGPIKHPVRPFDTASAG